METTRMSGFVTMQLVDGNQIRVPDSLHSLTAYVIAEQGDWFEDEIRFLRRLLRAGERVIDIGANYGVYTLSMARAVGRDGQVWAIEPSRATARQLRDSVHLNGYEHVIVEQVALGECAGQAKLRLHDNAELNGLVTDESDPQGADAGPVEMVEVVALDTFAARHGIRGVGFVKLDAEGAESAILEGAERFLATESPLIQYEAKAGETLHLELTDRFAERGYRSYTLLPGLGILAPFDHGAEPDGFLLNLFACRPDRAAALRARGLLVDMVDADFDVTELTRRALSSEWLKALGAKPYAAPHADAWQRWAVTEARTEAGAGLAAALALHHHAQDTANDPVERVHALRLSVAFLRDLTGQAMSLTRLSSLARIARQAGQQTVAALSLSQICNVIQKQATLAFNEPFLAPTQRFDDIAPITSPTLWLTAAALEAYELNCAFSSYFTGSQALGHLRYFQTLDYPSEVMAKRLKMVERRFEPASA